MKRPMPRQTRQTSGAAAIHEPSALAERALRRTRQTSSGAAKNVPSTLAALLVVLAPMQVRAQIDASESGRDERTQIGSLSRTAAAIQNVLDVYRLAIAELVPATQLLREAGEKATPDTEVPQVAAEVFTRLARVVPLRAAAEALPAITRGYHAEALDALEQLAAAKTLGATGVPLRELVRALGHMERGAEDVVDLFSRQRPVRVQIVDPETALDDVNEALDEVAAAEQRIGDLRATRASPADQLRAFMRLEVALGHALDLIAAAEESGVRVGFDAQKPTLSFSRVVAEYAQLRIALAESVEALTRVPQADLGTVRALETSAMSEDGNQRIRTVEIGWGLRSAREVAQLRVTRVANADDFATKLVAQTLCDGAPYSEALSHVHEAPAELSEVALTAAAIADNSYRASYVEPPGESAIRADIVLTPVSAFGIEGAAVKVTAAYTPRQAGEPRAVHADFTHLDARDPRFYRDFDAVHVRWDRAMGDVAPDPRLARVAEKHGTAIVKGYRVARISGQRAIVVGKTAPGITAIVDRPSLTELAEGVSYRVTAIGSRGGETVSNESCPARVRVDLLDDVGLAKLGAGALGFPAGFERTVEHELENEVTLSKARAAFESQPEEKRDELLARWWNSVPQRERLLWLSRWPSLMSASEREVWLSQAHGRITPHDFETWVLPELFLEGQSEQVKGEIDRWWSLVGVNARAKAYDSWLATLSSTHRAYVERAVQAGGAEGLEATRPLRVSVWWASRGEAEHQRAHVWWDRLDDASRQLRVQAWMGRLDPVAQVAVRWPAFETRAPNERDALVATAYRDLPNGLWRQALAWMAWQRMDTPARAGIVRAEVSAIPRLMARMAYAVRPLDKALGFNLRVFLVFSIFVTAFAMAVRRVVRSRGAIELRKLPALKGIEEAIDSAKRANETRHLAGNAIATPTKRATPATDATDATDVADQRRSRGELVSDTSDASVAVAITGVVIANDAQTLAGLHLLDYAADVAATRESTLAVSDREPFVQHSGLVEGVSGAGYALDELRVLGSPAMPFVPSARDVVTQTGGAGAILLGRLPSEMLVVTDALRPGAATLTATAERPTLAVARATSENVLIADAMVAAAADVARDPALLTTVLASDWMKLAVLGMLALLCLAATLGAFG